MKEGWEYKKLGDIALSMYRGSGIKKDQLTKNGIPCVRYGEIYTSYDYSFIDCISHTTESDIKPQKYFEHGDLLFAITGESVEEIGKTIAYLGNEKCMAGGDIVVMKHAQNPKYLSYALSAPDAIKQKGWGKTKLKVVHTSVPSLKSIIIPIPPLSEQQSIVEYLDSSFAKIDEMKENAEKALLEAKALFQAALKSLLEPKEGWEEKYFGDVCWYNKNNGIHKNGQYIGLEHIEQGTGNLLASIPASSVLSNTFAFNKGDVLYGRLRPYLKKVIVAEFDGCCSTEIFPVQSNEVFNHFLKYWFLTDKITNMINATSAGCRMPRGNMNDVLKFKISFPSLSEQQSIVATLDSIKNKVDQLQANYAKITQECDALKQALLRQVFE